MESLQTRLSPLLDLLEGQPYAQAAMIFILSILLAYLVSAFVRQFCVRITGLTRFKLDDKVASIVHAPIVYTILMVGFIIALTLLNPPESVHSMAVSILKTINILIWMVFATRLSKLLLRASAKSPYRIRLVHPQSLPLFENLAIIIIVGIAVYVAMQTWGINMTAWLASAGVLGIAIGFASKDTLSNFIAGIFILADAPYKIGDYVVLDTGERGEVTDIGIRSTRMLTRDDVELTIPNSIMGNTKIINESGGPYQKFRIRIPVGAAYGSDVDQVKSILLDVATGSQNVCKYPEPRVRCRLFGPSSIDYDLLCWVEHPSLRGSVIDELLTTIYVKFNQMGVEIPFSKQDLYIKEFPRIQNANPGD